MAKSGTITKRKTRANAAQVLEAILALQKEKKICDTSFSDSDTNYTFVEANEQVLQTTDMGE